MSYSYCENPIGGLFTSFDNETDFAVCEVFYWVNKKANSGFPVVPFSANYTDGEVREVIEKYQNGVINKEIPQWEEPRNPVIESKIIKYILLQTKNSKTLTEGRIRAIFANLVESVYSTGVNRKKINPCVLYPATENCKDTPLSKDYLGWRANQEREGFSTIKDIGNLAQSLTILAVVAVGGFFAVKLFGLK